MSRNILKYILFICLPLSIYAYNGHTDTYVKKNNFECNGISSSYYNSKAIYKATDLTTSIKVEETEEEDKIFPINFFLKKINYFTTYFKSIKFKKTHEGDNTFLGGHTSCFLYYKTQLYLILRVIKI